MAAPLGSTSTDPTSTAPHAIDEIPNTTAGASAADTSPAHAPLSSTPVEMSDLAQSQHAQGEEQAQPSNPAATAGNDTAITTAADIEPLSAHKRKDSEAIGPATDAPTPIIPTDAASGVTLQITLLLPSGARHPFKIDERYLKRRNVSVEEMNPLNISVYTMKELIWRDWRSEWEPRPTSPAYIRLIFFGAMLDDKVALKDCRFNATAPNVVHMSVKPQEMADEDNDVKQTAKKGGARSHSPGGAGESSSRCCIIL